MPPNTRTEVQDSYHRPPTLADQVNDAPWLGPHWADLVCLPAPSSPEEPENLGPGLPVAPQLDEEVSSYDDLFVSVGPTGGLLLTCPTCGSIPIPLRQTTLSDLTNAAMHHLGAQHPYTLTLPSPRNAATPPDASASPADAPSGYFTEHFWSLIALLTEDGAGIEALARTLASSSNTDIAAFREQLANAAALLDTSAHRVQRVCNLDDPLQTVPDAMSDDVFSQVRAAVVASGRDVWLGVLADPSRLTGGWSLQAGRVLLNAPASALDHNTHTPPHPSSNPQSGRVTGASLS